LRARTQIEIGRDEWSEILDSYRPLLGRYTWLLRLLAWRKRQIGFFPLRLHQRLQRFVSSSRPYFIGRTRQGVLFLGDVREYDSCHWAVGDSADEQVITRALELLRTRPGAYLDVGANCGVVAATLATLHKGSTQVVAFEPVPSTAARAAATFALNGLSAARLFQVAVGDQDGEIVIVEKEGHSGGASAVRHGEGAHGVRVPCRTLDNLVPILGLKDISLLKIDVEGFEPQVLQGAQQLLARQRPSVIYEYNAPVGQGGWTIEAMNNLIQQSGPYRFHGLSGDGVVINDVAHFQGSHLDVIGVAETAPISR
jgi:FkbM family methyltransferase